MKKEYIAPTIKVKAVNYESQLCDASPTIDITSPNSLIEEDASNAQSKRGFGSNIIWGDDE